MQEKNNSQSTNIKNKLDEAKSILDTQKALKLRNHWGSWLLKIGQYLTGAILASSFFQDALLAQVVGFLGLLILLFTFMNHRFRPDIKFMNAKTRILKLTRLIRTAEDCLSALAAKEKDAPDEFTIIKNISEGIDEVERSQHLDYALMRRKLSSRFAKPVNAVGNKE